MSADGADWPGGDSPGSGCSLDLASTAREVIGVAVPGFADAAVLYLPERVVTAGEVAWHRDGHARMRPLAAGPDGQPNAVAGRLMPPCELLTAGEDSPAFRAMAGRRPVTFRRPARAGERPADDPAAGEPDSFLAAPLVARESVLGCAVFARTAGPVFGPADVAQARELASRAALCIDSARLYDRQRRTAAALQRGLLPGRPRVPAGLEIAHRYLPTGGSIIGGDWYDVVSLPGGRAALIVGDAMGHGPEAAAVMVQLRSVAHTLTSLDLPPGEVLRRLDRAAAEMTSTSFATCVCAVLEPSAGSCVIAQAGHHPPLLVLPDGATRVLDLPPGLPLAVGAQAVPPPFEQTRIGLPPGATLALYTDGLVEGRTRPLDRGMTALRDALGSALARPGATLDGASAAVAGSLRVRDEEDDVTLVLARVRARRLVAEHLAGPELRRRVPVRP